MLRPMLEVLIGAVGYSFQGDLSAAHTVIARLREQSWPPGVSFEDLSVGPIAVVHNFQARACPYDRVVLVAAVPSDDLRGAEHSPAITEALDTLARQVREMALDGG